MADGEDILLKAELLLARLRESAETRAARRIRRRRRGRRLMSRLVRILLGWLAVLVGAAVFSATVAPLGFWGLLIVPLLLLLATLLAWRSTPALPDERPTLDRAEGPDLALKVEAWLDARRPALPAPARRELDRILHQLDALAPALGQIDPTRPEAVDARRLMADHLPRLIESFEAIPPSVRAREPEAARQLAAGLGIVADELGRISDRLAAERLDALETEGRFLESRWSRTGQPEG
ncbi:hypothetical protein [Thermaurantiacus sp.]